MTRVEVPPEFAALGYSGDFWLDIGFAPGVDPEEFRARCPFLMRSQGWMALRVNDGEPPTVTIVRRDAAAVWDLCTRRRSWTR